MASAFKPASLCGSLPSGNLTAISPWFRRDFSKDDWHLRMLPIYLFIPPPDFVISSLFPNGNTVVKNLPVKTAAVKREVWLGYKTFGILVVYHQAVCSELSFRVVFPSSPQPCEAQAPVFSVPQFPHPWVTDEETEAQRS